MGQTLSKKHHPKNKNSPDDLHLVRQSILENVGSLNAKICEISFSGPMFDGGAYKNMRRERDGLRQLANAINTKLSTGLDDTETVKIVITGLIPRLLILLDDLDFSDTFWGVFVVYERLRRECKTHIQNIVSLTSVLLAQESKHILYLEEEIAKLRTQLYAPSAPPPEESPLNCTN